MQWTHLIFAFLLILVWGFNFVVIKVGLDQLPPLLLCFSRFFLTSIPLVFFIKRPQCSFKKVLFYGLVMFALQFTLLFMGMKMGVAPGFASILLQLHVFFSIFLGAFFFGEKIRPWQILGGIVAFSGIGFIVANLHKTLTLSGFFLVLTAAAFWGTGSAVVKKMGNVNMISLVVWGSFVAWPPLLLLSVLIEGPHQVLHLFNHLSFLSWGAVLYITYLSTLFGFGYWNFLIQHYPLTTVAPFTLLVPVIALISSSLFLGEHLESWKILAALLVIGGLCINLAGPKLFQKISKSASLMP